MDFGADGTVWAGTDRGLIRLKADSGLLLGQVGQLPSQQVLAIAPDVGNKLWVGTYQGLAWVSLTTGLTRPHYGFVEP